MKTFLVPVLLLCGVAYAGDGFSVGSTAEPAPPLPVDTDRDGKPDPADPCPHDPQDKCDDPPPPPTDRDGDGIPDDSDACPDDATNTCHDVPPDLHPDDESKRHEHLAALALVPVAEASHTLTDGPLPALPDGAKVYIPSGVTVMVDREHAERIKWLRVNGTLRLTDAAVHFNCDTCVVDDSGWLDLGASRTAPLEWLFIDNGPVADPMQLSRGIVCHGRFDCVCAEGVEITFRSENTERLHRGHFMQMHKPAFTADGLKLVDCGRTDKSVPVTDFPDVGNLRARYPLHFHRTGLITPINIRRVTVEHSPGWGVVNHESFVNCDDSICRDTYGAGFVSEIGRERGHFRNVLAEDIPGRRVSVEDSTGGNPGAVDDWGVAGHGIWIQGGGNVAVEDFAVRRCTSWGVVVMGGGFGDPFFSLDEVDPEFARLRSAESIWPWGRNVRCSDVPARVRRGTIEQCGKGESLVLWGNCNPSQHDHERAIVEDVTVDGTILSGYSNRTDYKRITSTGDINNPAGGAYGHTGVVFDHTYEALDIRGFKIGIHAPTDGINAIRGCTFQNVIDIFVTNKTQPVRNGRTLAIDDNVHLPLPEGVYLAQHWPTFNGPLPEPGRYHTYLYPCFVWFDIRNTSQPSDWWPNLFNAKDTFFVPDVTTVNGRRLVYPEWASDFPLPGMIPEQYRLTLDGAVKTSGELYAEKAWALFGRVPVNEWEYVPNVRGRFTK